jgi:hypothetical protein
METAATSTGRGITLESVVVPIRCCSSTFQIENQFNRMFFVLILDA